jgi:HAMP domain-containing protein
MRRKDLHYNLRWPASIAAMFSRKPIRIAWTLLLLSGATLSGTALFAQQNTADWRIQREREREADELGKRNREPLKTVHTEVEAANAAVAEYREKMQKAQFERFRVAFVQFLEARRDFSVALGRKESLKDSARRIEKTTGVFVDLIGRFIGQRPRPVFTENKDPAERGRSVLTLAQQLSPYLLTVIESEKSETLDVSFLESLPKIQVELQRLQSMTRKLK